MTHIGELSTEQVLLERVRVGARVSASNYVLANLRDVNAWQEHLADAVVHEFSSEVLAQRLDTRTVDQRVEWEVPASWWQMFKATYALSWWLAWLVDRRPVRYEVKHKFVSIKYGVDAIYPDARIRLPEETFGRPFVVNRLVSAHE